MFCGIRGLEMSGFERHSTDTDKSALAQSKGPFEERYKGRSVACVGFLWVERTLIGAPGLGSSFPRGANNWRIGRNGAVGDKPCDSFALSCSRRMDTVVISKPGEKQEKERTVSLEFVAAFVMMSKKVK